ncbi:MAG: FAD binding domain-containing protein [Pseudorhodobacter sp.]
MKPKTLAEALAALADGAQPLSGGQTLLPTLKQRLADPGTLVSLTHIPELRSIKVEAADITIGGAVTHTNVAKSTAEVYPALAALAGQIGDPAVRNRGTLGGSIANNDPSACYPAAALASGATIVTNARTIAADDFFLGMFETPLEEGEIVTALRFPIPLAAGYAKFLQPASHFALVGVFVARFAAEVRVAVTGASNNGVFRWHEAEAALGHMFSPQSLAGLTLPDEDMIADLHGSAEYRAHLCAVMARRAVETALNKG